MDCSYKGLVIILAYGLVLTSTVQAGDGNCIKLMQVGASKVERASTSYVSYTPTPIPMPSVTSTSKGDVKHVRQTDGGQYSLEAPRSENRNDEEVTLSADAVDNLQRLNVIFHGQPQQIVNFFSNKAMEELPSDATIDEILNLSYKYISEAHAQFHDNNPNLFKALVMIETSCGMDGRQEESPEEPTATDIALRVLRTPYDVLSPRKQLNWTTDLIAKGMLDVFGY